MPALDGVEHHFADVRGAHLHVAEMGDPAGPPVLLLHGWPQHWWSWRELMPLMADRYRVLARDLRGFGWSERPRAAGVSWRRSARPPERRTREDDGAQCRAGGQRSVDSHGSSLIVSSLGSPLASPDGRRR